MNNEQFPAPDPSGRVEAFGNMQANPLDGQGIPGVEVEQVSGTQELIDSVPSVSRSQDITPESITEYRYGQLVQSQPRTSDGEGIGPDDPRYAVLMAKRQDSMDMITAAAGGADVRGKRLH